MRVLLINAGWRRAGAGRRRYRRAWPPLDLLNLAALLRKDGHEASLIDERAGFPSALEAGERIAKADRIIYQTSPLDRWQCPELDLYRLREMTVGLPSEKLIVAGIHGTLFPEKVLRLTGARTLILGEPERTGAELIRAGGDPRGIHGTAYLSDDELTVEPVRDPIQLDYLEPPAYDLVDDWGYVYELMGSRLAVLETSRGCPFNCKFCLKTMYGRGYRVKSLGAAIRDIRTALSAGARSIYFMDLEFTVDRDRCIAICREMAAMNRTFDWCCQTRVDLVDEELLIEMKKAGCKLIHFGVESGSAGLLRATGKGISLNQAAGAIGLCRGLGIRTAAFFLMGLPGETEADRRITAKAARELDPDYASFHPAAPYPGTIWGKAAGGDEPMPGCLPEHDPGVLARAVRRAYLSFYLRPGYAWKQLISGGGDGRLKSLRLFWDFIG